MDEYSINGMVSRHKNSFVIFSLLNYKLKNESFRDRLTKKLTNNEIERNFGKILYPIFIEFCHNHIPKIRLESFVISYQIKTIATV